MNTPSILLVGEVCVDYTIGTATHNPKMRLGGIVHAARALWAYGIAYSVAAVCPRYLFSEVEDYLTAHGCSQLYSLGEITGAPNVVLIGDVREVGHQGYEDLLRERRKYLAASNLDYITNFSNIIVFPGFYDLDLVAKNISKDAIVSVDIAYDIESMDELLGFNDNIETIILSTSSSFFEKIAKDDVSPLLVAAKRAGAKSLLLKENRGGSRLFNLETGEILRVPAVLGSTKNSVGVGDAYTAVFAALCTLSKRDAVWRGMQVATRYSQTTFVDDLKRDVSRDKRLTVELIAQLGGTSLTWHERSDFEIYLAAPDFSYIEKAEIDTAVAALEYHNFRVRRPIVENGEASQKTPKSELKAFYNRDIELLNSCSIVFAIPLQRDPGTLIEVGMAIEMKKPVITFDPRNENANTMVMCGSYCYSDDLDACLNATYDCLSQLRELPQ
jgi:nucleoside 2-deoxyribosyltransferase